MSIEVYEGFPSRITAGETIKWVQPAPGFRAEDGWAMRATLVTLSTGGGKKAYINLSSATAQGDRFEFELDMVQSVTMECDINGTDWMYSACVSDPSEKADVARSRFKVFLLAENATGGVDIRTQNEKILDALECALAGNAGQNIASYSIEGVSIARMGHAELVAAIGKYKWLVRLERAKGTRGVGIPVFTVSRGRRGYRRHRVFDAES